MMTNAAPNQSILTPMECRLGRCRKRLTMNSANAPIGTLIRKTQRHPVMNRIWSAPANRPPTSGPMTLETPKTAKK